MQPDYALAFVMGLLGGGGHCIGMCGPIVAAYTMYGSSRAISHILYHIGRVLTYSMIGALMGLSGTFVNTAGRLAGIQDAVSIAAGGLMVIMGAGILLGRNPASAIETGSGPIIRMAKAVLGSESVMKFFPLGLLMGFLPCGLSYTAFIAASGTGHMLKGFLLMLSFGFGTVGPLLLFGGIVVWLGTRWRAVVYSLGGMTVIAMGIVFIIRGVSHASL